MARGDRLESIGHRSWLVRRGRIHNGAAPPGGAPGAARGSPRRRVFLPARPRLHGTVRLPKTRPAVVPRCRRRARPGPRAELLGGRPGERHRAGARARCRRAWPARVDRAGRRERRWSEGHGHSGGGRPRGRGGGDCARRLAPANCGAMEPWRELVVLLALVAQGPTRGTIAVGDAVRASLTRHDLVLPAESTYAQQWRLRGRAGETVTIDLASTAFDAYLFLLGPNESPKPPQDDDSGGRCNARLTLRLPASGDYLIVATSSERHATGAFTRFRWRLINIHPALLPAFGGDGMYGRRVHEAVLASGAALSGATVHYVDEEYDRGPILAQWPVPVRGDDTPDSLAARVLEVEHRLLPAVVLALARLGVPERRGGPPPPSPALLPPGAEW